MKNPANPESVQSAGTVDNLTITEQKPCVKIPPAVIELLEREIQGVDFGGVSLIIAVRGGHLNYRIEKTISFLAKVGSSLN